MDLPGSTDVLSFPMDEMKPNSAANGPGVIGDIVLCPAYAERNGKQSLAQELELLTVHGVLHLLGYDHEEIDQEVAMFKLQEDFLQQWRALQ
jgi:probable rRNA maturation factor